MVVGKLLSFWETLLSGAMLVSGRVNVSKKCKTQLRTKFQIALWHCCWCTNLAPVRMVKPCLNTVICGNKININWCCSLSMNHITTPSFWFSIKTCQNRPNPVIIVCFNGSTSTFSVFFLGAMTTGTGKERVSERIRTRELEDGHISTQGW